MLAVARLDGAEGEHAVLFTVPGGEQTQVLGLEGAAGEIERRPDRTPVFVGEAGVVAEEHERVSGLRGAVVARNQVHVEHGAAVLVHIFQPDLRVGDAEVGTAADDEQGLGHGGERAAPLRDVGVGFIHVQHELRAFGQVSRDAEVPVERDLLPRNDVFGQRPLTEPGDARIALGVELDRDRLRCAAADADVAGVHEGDLRVRLRPGGEVVDRHVERGVADLLPTDAAGDRIHAHARGLRGALRIGRNCHVFVGDRHDGIIRVVVFAQIPHGALGEHEQGIGGLAERDLRVREGERIEAAAVVAFKQAEKRLFRVVAGAVLPDIVFVYAEVVHGEDRAAAPASGVRVVFRQPQRVVARVLHRRGVHGGETAVAVNADRDVRSARRGICLGLFVRAGRVRAEERDHAAALGVGDAHERRLADQIGRAVHVEQQEMLGGGGLQGEILFFAGQRVADLRVKELQVVEIRVVAARNAHAVAVHAVGEGVVVVEIIERAQEDRLAALVPSDLAAGDREGAKIQALDREQVRGVRRVGRPAARLVRIHLFARGIHDIIPVADLRALDVVDVHALGEGHGADRAPVLRNAELRLSAVDRPRGALQADAVRGDLRDGLFFVVKAVALVREIDAVLFRLRGELGVGIGRRADVNGGVARESGHRHGAVGAADRHGGGKAVAAGREGGGLHHGVLRGRRQRAEHGVFVMHRRFGVADPHGLHSAVLFAHAER